MEPIHGSPTARLPVLPNNETLIEAHSSLGGVSVSQLSCCEVWPMLYILRLEIAVNLRGQEQTHRDFSLLLPVHRGRALREDIECILLFFDFRFVEVSGNIPHFFSSSIICIIHGGL